MAVKRSNVFLNVPFDDEYEPLFVALVAALTAFGIRPRTVLEIPTQNARLDRLRALIAECGASVHDLSRVELTKKPRPAVPRFNMPFELGLTLGIHADPQKHAWFIFESAPYRVDRSLSDLKGYDPQIHHGTPEGILRAIANAFGAKNRALQHADLLKLTKLLSEVVPRIRASRESLFTPAAFADLVIMGERLAIGYLHRRKSPAFSNGRVKR